MNKLAITALVIDIVTASAQSVFAEEQVKLVLDYAIQGQQSPIVFAQDGGFFAKAGVNVVVDRGYGSADAISKVATGAYDFAFADVGALIQFNGREDNHTKLVDVFQVYDVAPMVILALKTSTISMPTDLNGKRIASPPGASSRVMFPAFAAANKIDASSIQWIDVTPQLRETLLVQGKTDATTALITDLAGLRNLNVSESDLRVFRYSDYGVPLYGHGILTTSEFASKNPEIVKKVVKGVADALEASILDPSLPIKAIQKRDPLVEAGVERQRLDLVLESAVVTDHVRKFGLSAVDPVRMKSTVDIVKDSFKLTAIDPGSIYTADFLPPRSELMFH
jgi:NitT/TauT family transport system substrate-binding protein